MKPQFTFAPRSILFALCCTLAITGCTNKAPVEAVSLQPKETPVALISTMAKQVQKCWFRSKDKAFRKYKVATEVNSHIGRPRILLVPKNKPTGLPVLVVESENAGRANRLSTYGPILASTSGPRIRTDIANWRRGNRNC